MSNRNGGPQSIRTPQHNVQRVRDFGTLSQDIFTKPLPSELRELCRGGGGEITRARGDGGHQGKCLLDTTGLMLPY